MTRLLFVIGARPNFVKMAPICRVMRDYPEINYSIVHTGQHYDRLMSDVFFSELEIPEPDYHLNIGSGPHGEQTGKMMGAIERICLQGSFAGIIVIGDVNSTLAGALAAAKLNLPVAHVEAGLRSYNRQMPEEVNRIVADHVSDLLFAPSRRAMDNLRREGLEDRAIFSGDVMYDMALAGLERAERRPSVLARWSLLPREYYLTTLHRPYNVDNPETLREIMAGLSALEDKVLLPAHPRLRKNLGAFNVRYGPNIFLAPPLGYLDFIRAVRNARCIFTDSGGVQKEAFFLQTPCITLRPETEWVETVESGANLLVVERTRSTILAAAAYDFSPRFDDRPYGDGHASEVIVRTLLTEMLAPAFEPAPSLS